jgi:flagellar basal-body rod protein FlgB
VNSLNRARAGSMVPASRGRSGFGDPSGVKGVAVFDDIASAALQAAINGLTMRQKAIANNIANIETPGFKADKVAFERALQDALNNGASVSELLGVRPKTAKSLEPTRLNGNNVNLDEETLSNVDENLRYQMVVRALDAKFTMLHDVIKG